MSIKSETKYTPRLATRRHECLGKILLASLLGASLLFVSPPQLSAQDYRCGCPLPEGRFSDECKPDTKYHCVASGTLYEPFCVPFPEKPGARIQWPPTCVLEPIYMPPDWVLHCTKEDKPVDTPAECSHFTFTTQVPICGEWPDCIPNPQEYYTKTYNCNEAVGNGWDGLKIQENGCSSARTQAECEEKKCTIQQTLRGDDEETQCSTDLTEERGCKWTTWAPAAPTEPYVPDSKEPEKSPEES